MRSISSTAKFKESVRCKNWTFLSRYFSARSVFLISRVLRASVWMTPATLPLLSVTGKLVKPDLYNLSKTSGPRISFLSTKTIWFLGIMRSATVRVSKLMMAAIRARSVLLRIVLGVRRSTSINSGKVLGVYLGVGAEDFFGRYFSNFGSINLTNFRIISSNML